VNTDLVSVVIPAYNAAATLGETLKSVRAQTHQNLEIIVVDDGSTDGTLSVYQAQATTDNRLRLISQRNGGVAFARNAGWQSARSGLIAFVDADDLWAPTKIERQLEVMRAGGEQMGLVYTWFAVLDETSRIRYKVVGRGISGNVLKSALKENFVGHASSPLIRCEALVRAGGFDSNLLDAGVHGCEDLLLYYRISREFQFGLVQEHLTGYRVVSGRMSSDRLRMFRSYQMVANQMKIDYPEHDRVVDAGVRSYLRFLVGEAIVFRDFDQISQLLSFWRREHPLGAAFLPLEACISKVTLSAKGLAAENRDRIESRRTGKFLLSKRANFLACFQSSS
jgi:glycosyltransferase involved in cell wall biosynthesis